MPMKKYRILSKILSNVPVNNKHTLYITKKIIENNGFEVDKYDLPIDPIQVHWIDPKEITMITGRNWKPWSNLLENIGNVMDGEWDKTTPDGIPDSFYGYPKKFEDLGYTSSLEARVIEGIPWEDTHLYSVLMHNYASEETVLSKVNKFENLYYRIKKEGYTTQREQYLTNPDFSQSSFGVFTDEVTVDLSRDGVPLFVDGRHRLSIAKLLNLERIPVIVVVRHKKWISEIKGTNFRTDKIIY